MAQIFIHIHNDRRDPDLTTPVTIFVSALSFSDYFYIEGLTCCDICNWIRVNNNAASYFGGITQTITPDNCKVAVNENQRLDQSQCEQLFSRQTRKFIDELAVIYRKDQSESKTAST